MEKQMLHIFRNTPFGREMMLQTAYFCNNIHINPVAYIPAHLKFLMYFENDVVQVDLDQSYLRAPDTARQHATEIITAEGLQPPKFIAPKHFTASTLPDIPVDFDFMTCPRSISDLSSKIGLGYIGPRVRRIVQSARFPVLIPSSVFKPWNSITVFFGGSANAVKALRLGLRIGRLSGKPVNVFTQERRRSRADYEAILEENDLLGDMEKSASDWQVFSSGDFRDNLYHVPHDALVILGAYGHGLLRELLFGSTMETVQTVLPNTLLIVGPHYRASI